MAIKVNLKILEYNGKTFLGKNELIELLEIVQENSLSLECRMKLQSLIEWIMLAK